MYWQLWYFQSSIISTLTLFRMSLFETVLRWGPGGISCNDGTWHIYTFPKEDPKKLLITWNSPWALLTFFHRKLSNFAISRNADIIAFRNIISNSFNISWIFKDVLINMITIFMMSAKMATLGLLKLKVF